MGSKSFIRSREAGSLHVVIIAVLFVALMATLGVVFYQNFIAKKMVVVEAPKTEETKSLTTRVGFNSEIYGIEYPKDWKSITTKSETDAATGPSITKITNSDGTVQVAFTVTSGGLGGTCDTSDGLKISYYHIKDVPVANLTSEPVYLVETISDSLGGGYEYNIGLTPDGGETHAAVGESHCNVRYVGVASRVALDGDKMVKPTIIANITFPKLQPKTGVAIKDMRQIKEAMGTAGYKSAVKIIESAHKE